MLDLDRIELQPGRLSAFLQINVGFGADVATRSFDEFGRLRCENVPHVPAFFRYPYPPTVQCLMTASVRTRPHASVVSSRGARAPVRSSRSRNSQYTIPRTNVAPASAPISRALETGIAQIGVDQSGDWPGEGLPLKGSGARDLRAKDAEWCCFSPAADSMTQRLLSASQGVPDCHWKNSIFGGVRAPLRVDL